MGRWFLLGQLAVNGQPSPGWNRYGFSEFRSMLLRCDYLNSLYSAQDVIGSPDTAGWGLGGLMIGSTLSNYRITGSLGAGGMGEVWRAEDTNLGREVAIKVLPEELAAEPERIARFEREARTLASLNHPCIGAIYGLEKVDGRQLLIMELVEGEDLTETIKGGPLSLEQTEAIVAQIAAGLEYAHQQGIVHRDQG